MTCFANETGPIVNVLNAAHMHKEQLAPLIVYLPNGEDDEQIGICGTLIGLSVRPKLVIFIISFLYLEQEPALFVESGLEAVRFELFAFIHMGPDLHHECVSSPIACPLSSRSPFER